MRNATTLDDGGGAIGADRALASSHPHAPHAQAPHPHAPHPLAPHPLDPGAVLSSIGGAVYDWDLASDRITWSEGAVTLLRAPSPSRIATGRAFAALVDPLGPPSREDAVARAAGHDAGTGVPYVLRYALIDDGRGGRWVEDAGRWFAGPDGRPALAHGVLRLIPPPAEAEAAAATAGRIDPLTGALTRFAFARRLEEECGNGAPGFVFLLAALDDLALVNAAYGPEIGDELIAGCARRLRSVVRARDRVVRYAGNKFGLLLASCPPERMEDAALRAVACVRDAPIVTSAGPLAALLRVGGLVAPRDARTPSDVMRRAEEALGQARRAADAVFVPYVADPGQDAARRRNALATDDVLRALNERRVLLAYQPIVSTRTGGVAYHEALVRVRTPEGDVLGAAAVVPAAERLGLIRLVDHRVLELALAKLAATPALKLSVNVSLRTALDPGWLAALTATLAGRPDLAPRLLVEVTETALIEDLEAVSRLVGAVKLLGARVAIDDFGAGHTSFRALRGLPVDVLKIDGAFVQNLARNPDDRFFVRTLVDLARHLGVETVAEWVQDAESARLLAEWGVDYLQGDHCGAAGLALGEETGTAARAAPPARRASA